jgi:hypothetical protein
MDNPATGAGKQAANASHIYYILHTPRGLDSVFPEVNLNRSWAFVALLSWKLGPAVAACAARFFGADHIAAGRLQCGTLDAEVLIEGRNARVAI